MEGTLLYPVNLKIAGRACLVVGGGRVAARKIASLLISKADVLVVSPRVCNEISALARSGKIRWLEREFRDSDMESTFLVFAATDNSSVQEQIVRQAKKRGVLVNSANSPEKSDFHVPASIRQGELLLSVSTSGGSPALSAQIRQQLQNEFGPEYGVLVSLMSKIRMKLVGSELSQEENRSLFLAVLSEPVLEFIRKSEWELLQEKLMKILPAFVDCGLLIAEFKEEMN